MLLLFATHHRYYWSQHNNHYGTLKYQNTQYILVHKCSRHIVVYECSLFMALASKLSIVQALMVQLVMMANIIRRVCTRPHRVSMTKQRTSQHRLSARRPIVFHLAPSVTTQDRHTPSHRKCRSLEGQCFEEAFDE